MASEHFSGHLVSSQNLCASLELLQNSACYGMCTTHTHVAMTLAIDAHYTILPTYVRRQHVLMFDVVDVGYNPN